MEDPLLGAAEIACALCRRTSDVIRLPIILGFSHRCLKVSNGAISHQAGRGVISHRSGVASGVIGAAGVVGSGPQAALPLTRAALCGSQIDIAIETATGARVRFDGGNCNYAYACALWQVYRIARLH